MVGIAFAPLKADAPLLIYSDAMLILSFSGQLFEVI